MSPAPQITIRKADGWLSAKVGVEVVMMSVEHGRYVGLNETAARIWDLLDTSPEPGAICAELVREFDVEAAVCRRALDALVADLVEHGVVTVGPGPGPAP